MGLPQWTEIDGRDTRFLNRLALQQAVARQILHDFLDGLSKH